MRLPEVVNMVFAAVYRYFHLPWCIDRRRVSILALKSRRDGVVKCKHDVAATRKLVIFKVGARVN